LPGDARGGVEGRMAEGHEETFKVDGYVQYLDVCQLYFNFQNEYYGGKRKGVWGEIHYGRHLGKYNLPHSAGVSTRCVLSTLQRWY